MLGYKIMCNVWDNSGYDYITGEYDGVIYKNLDEAREIARKAMKEGLNEVYIMEVEMYD